MVDMKPAAPAPEAPKTVRIRLLKSYWPEDGRINPQPNRKAAHARRFDAGEIVELPAAEALKLLNPMTMKDVTKERIDENGRHFKEDYIRPPIAVRADAYSV